MSFFLFVFLLDVAPFSVVRSSKEDMVQGTRTVRGPCYCTSTVCVAGLEPHRSGPHPSGTGSSIRGHAMPKDLQRSRDEPGPGRCKDLTLSLSASLRPQHAIEHLQPAAKTTPSCIVIVGCQRPRSSRGPCGWKDEDDDEDDDGCRRDPSLINRAPFLKPDPGR